ncbi:MAG: DMT family transporter [Pseudomonadota bacterium]
MSETAKGHLAVIAFAAIVSGSFALGGLAAPFLDPAALNAVRFLIAAIAMGAVALAGPGLALSNFSVAPWRYLVLGGCMALYFVTMFEALRLTDPVSTGAVFTLTPVMSAIFGWLLMRQVTTRFNASALLLGAVGAVWVIFRGDMAAILAFDIGPGEKLFFFGAVGHALYTPLVRHLNRGEPVAAFTFGTIVAALILISLLAGPELWRTDWAAMPAIVWITIFYTAIMATAGTFFLLQFASLRLPAGKAMAYTYLTPVFVILWEAALGHGWPVITVWFGASVAVAALALLAWR